MHANLASHHHNVPHTNSNSTAASTITSQTLALDLGGIPFSKTPAAVQVWHHVFISWPVFLSSASGVIRILPFCEIHIIVHHDIIL